MCGICAIVARKNKKIPHQVMQDMLQRISHRGPDDSGVAGYNIHGNGLSRVQEAGEADVLLGHRRLSILDLSDSGHQPLTVAGSQSVLTFNGEIYNYVELRETLEKEGVRFETESDTEVLLQAYNRWAEDCLLRLKGMFAFIILDSARKRLFVARDCFGIKPLYMRTTPTAIYFGSECKMLFDVDTQRVSGDLNVVHQYLYNGRTEHLGDTFFSDVKTFPAASYALIDLDSDDRVSTEPVRYWNPEFGGYEGTFDEAAVSVRDLLSDSVRIHLRSDVAVGANISGGLDSSSLVNLAHHHMTGSSIQLFTYSSDDTKKNEDTWVKAACDRLNWPVEHVRFSWDDLDSQLNEVIYHQDYPFASLSMFAENQIYKRASELGIKVMLGGQGADEYFGGYTRYLAARFVSLISQGKYAAAWQFLNASAAFSGLNKKHILMFAGHYLLPPKANLLFRQMIGKSIYPEWTDADYFKSRNVGHIEMPSHKTRQRLSEQLWSDTTQGGLLHHLRSEDRSSMQYSIESRVPFLERNLVEFVLSLPENYLIANSGESKSVLRAAMKGVVPDAILDRKDKIGFETGGRNWLPIIEKTVREEIGSVEDKLPCLRRNELMKMLDASLANPGAKSDVLWRVLNLSKWVGAYGVEFD